MPSSFSAGTRTPNAVTTIASIARGLLSGLGVTFVSERVLKFIILSPQPCCYLELSAQRASFANVTSIAYSYVSQCQQMDELS